MIEFWFVPPKIISTVWREVGNMSVPERTPLWKSDDRPRFRRLTLLLTADAIYGLVNMLGGKAESASQVLLRDIVPTALFGAILVISAVLMWLGWLFIGSLFGIAAWGMIAIASVQTIINGTALSWAGPTLLLYMAGRHMLITYESLTGVGREHKQYGT